MKIFDFYFWKAIKVAGSAHKKKKKKTGSVGLAETQVFLGLRGGNEYVHISVDCRVVSRRMYPVQVI